MRNRTVRRSRDRGAAIVEFAVVLPLFLLLIGGLIDFGRVYYTQVMLTNAAREGARAAMYGNNATTRANAALSNKVSNTTVTATTCAVGATTGQAQVTVSVPFKWTLLKPAMALFDKNIANPTLTGKATMQCGG